MKRFLTKLAIVLLLGIGTIFQVASGQELFKSSPNVNPFGPPVSPNISDPQNVDPFGGQPVPNEYPFGPPPVPQKISDSQKVRKAIEKNIVMDYLSTPFTRVIDDVSKKLDIPIVIHRKGVESAGISVDARVTFRTSNFQIPAKSALTLFLDQYDLGFVVENDVLKITSKELLKLKQEDASAYPEKMKTSAEPNLPEKLIQNKLNSGVSIKFSQTTLREAMSNFEALIQTPVFLDPLGLKVEGVSPEDIVSLELSNDIVITVKSALTLILDQVRLTYVVENEVVKVTSKKLIDQKHEAASRSAEQAKRSAISPKEHALDSKIDSLLQEHKKALNDLFKGHNGNPFSKPAPTEIEQSTRSKLLPLLEEQFSIRQIARAQELTDLEKEVARMRDLHQSRENQKNVIVKDRIDQLLKDASGLGWGSSVAIQSDDKDSANSTKKILNEAMAEAKFSLEGVPAFAEEELVIWCLNSLTRYDKNKNGEISIDEWPGRSDGDFKTIDTNQSGTISLAEYYIWKQAQSK